MKTIYTIGWIKNKRRGILPIHFSKRKNADKIAHVLGDTFHADTWSIINNVYTKDEITWIALNWVILHAYGMPWHTYYSKCFFDDTQKQWNA